MIVVDASAALEVLLNSRLAAAVSSALFDSQRSLHAPHLLDLEVCQVLRRMLRRSQIESQRAEQALADLADFPIERYAHTPMLSRIWALRENLTAYDAAYMVLAEALDAELVTCDAALKSVPGCRARVNLVTVNSVP